MEFKNYRTVSPAVREQIDKVRDIWQRHIGTSLVGIYIHGSLCLECFLESTSDIDILIVTDRKINREERLSIVKEIMMVDRKPCPLEMSAIWTQDLQKWEHPACCQFHYSDYWTEHYVKLLKNEIHASFIVDEDFADPDIACHVKLTRQCGICLCGKAVNEVFPEVSDKDFWDSISSDIEDYDFNNYEPRYFASNILILGRILSYKVEKRILSKYHGALWTIEHIPEKYRYIVQNALNAWYNGAKLPDYKEDELEEFRRYLVNEIENVD